MRCGATSVPGSEDYHDDRWPTLRAGRSPCRWRARCSPACGDDDQHGTPTSTTTTDGSTSAEPVIDPGDGGDYEPELDPADFVDVIDNPYLPLAPGSRGCTRARSDGEAERIEVEVPDERATSMGISAVVVRDTVYVDGELVEDTFDWYAQDSDGNVWYLGEDTHEYEDGEAVTPRAPGRPGSTGPCPAS